MKKPVEKRKKKREEPLVLLYFFKHDEGFKKETGSSRGGMREDWRVYKMDGFRALPVGIGELERESKVRGGYGPWRRRPIDTRVHGNAYAQPNVARQGWNEGKRRVHKLCGASLLGMHPWIQNIAFVLVHEPWKWINLFLTKICHIIITFLFSFLSLNLSYLFSYVFGRFLSDLTTSPDARFERKKSNKEKEKLCLKTKGQ